MLYVRTGEQEIVDIYKDVPGTDTQAIVPACSEALNYSRTCAGYGSHTQNIQLVRLTLANLFHRECHISWVNGREHVRC